MFTSKNFFQYVLVFCFAATFFASSTASAGLAPVGSYYKVQGTLVNGAVTRSYWHTSVILSYSGDTVTETYSYQYNDSAAVTTTRTRGVDIRNSDATDLAAHVQECTHGVKETVTDVAGTFLTCKISMAGEGQTGDVWIAAVPGGEVKGVWNFSDGRIYSYEMNEFTW